MLPTLIVVSVGAKLSVGAGTVAVPVPEVKSGAEAVMVEPIRCLRLSIAVDWRERWRLGQSGPCRRDRHLGRIVAGQRHGHAVGAGADRVTARAVDGPGSRRYSAVRRSRLRDIHGGRRMAARGTGRNRGGTCSTPVTSPACCSLRPRSNGRGHGSRGGLLEVRLRSGCHAGK